MTTRRINEFEFEQNDSDSGALTYRCIELWIAPAGDEFSESELDLIQEIVQCLNEHFVDPADAFFGESD